MALRYGTRAPQHFINSIIIKSRVHCREGHEATKASNETACAIPLQTKHRVGRSDTQRTFITRSASASMPRGEHSTDIVPKGSPVGCQNCTGILVLIMFAQWAHPRNIQHSIALRYMLNMLLKVHGIESTSSYVKTGKSDDSLMYRKTKVGSLRIASFRIRGLSADSTCLPQVSGAVPHGFTYIPQRCSLSFCSLFRTMSDYPNYYSC